MTNKTIVVRERFQHMGSHSGYDQLFIPLERNPKILSVWHYNSKRYSSLYTRLLQHYFYRLRKTPIYELSSLDAEARLSISAILNKPTLIHFAYLESCFALFAEKKRRSSIQNIVCTTHQPPSWWKLFAMPQLDHLLSNIETLIVLSRSVKPFFQEHTRAKIHFLPHPVDTEFFSPLEHRPQQDNFTCLFVGEWLRDVDQMKKVVSILCRKRRDIQFKLVVPKRLRNKGLLEIARFDQVEIFCGLTDDELLEIYQKANCLFLPLIDSTANNAILEAASCGLPIVTNRNGGIDDYVRPDFGLISESNSTSELVDMIESLADGPDDASAMGEKARVFVLEKFRPSALANQLQQIYKDTSDGREAM